MEKMIDKVLVMNKPKGWTSHDVVNKVRRVYGVKKVGHAGTLDPMATGILIILIGKATKRQAEFMNMEKEYEAEITFGAETDTYDGEGKVVGTKGLRDKGIKNLDKKRVEEILKEVEGEIEQVVPPYSAVKIKGKKLYELARKRKIRNVELPKRKVFIKKIELLGFQPYYRSPIPPPSEESHSGHLGGVPWPAQADAQPIAELPKAKIRVICSKGTYIRSLAHDLGQKLGCGAFLSELVRTRVGKFRLASEEVVQVEDIKIITSNCTNYTN